ncbi:MAG: restriction endonuclease [Thermoanaerobaculia bacterium]|nr:restriction endonuclease [Thermoanaerobaculia bacterium]
MSKRKPEKPKRTRTEHLLPFEKLSPDDFERLTLALVIAEGFEQPQHLGATGGDQGRDIEAWRAGRRFVFQCKRVKKFGPATAKKEISKLGERPDELVFVVSCQVSPSARAAIQSSWGDARTCQFWALAELDAKVNRHPALVRQFFGLPVTAPAGPNLYLPFSSLGRQFAGRESALDNLRSSLECPGSGVTAISVKAIHGLGGVGKTRLAIEFGWRFRAEYLAVLFVDASSAANLRTGLAGLAGAALGLPEGAEADDGVREVAVLRWLQSHPGWLLILDNVDDDDAALAVTALLGRVTGGHVILTGRLANWGAEVDAQELDVLAEADAAAFVLDRTAAHRRQAPDDAACATELARELGGLPLALEQAAAFLCRHRQTIAAYLADWQTERERVLGWFDERIMKYPASVAVTWTKSVEKLTPSAKRLLELVAWLGPEPIPEFLLGVPVPGVEEEGEKSGVEKRGALADLAAYSLVSRSRAGETFTVHGLVQDVTRREQVRGNEGAERKGRLEEAIGWVNAAIGGDDWRTWKWPGLLVSSVQSLVTHAIEAGLTTSAARLVDRLSVRMSVGGLLVAYLTSGLRRTIEKDPKLLRQFHGQEHLLRGLGESEARVFEALTQIVATR